jgi:hypothetical protein
MILEGNTALLKNTHAVKKKTAPNKTWVVTEHRRSITI